MKTKKEYSAPALTVVAFQVDRGYVDSYQPTRYVDLFPQTTDDDHNGHAQENWHEGGNFFGNNSGW